MPTTTLFNRTGTSVALTSRWIAAARAHESARRDRLFADPFAAALADTVGLGSGGGESRVVTPFLDALILQAVRTSCRSTCLTLCALFAIVVNIC
jgi:O-methyltransferase involved in polyketide biosynthesis